MPSLEIGCAVVKLHLGELATEDLHEKVAVAARRLKDAGGIPAYGNDTRNWDLSDPDHPNPEYRA